MFKTLLIFFVAWLVGFGFFMTPPDMSKSLEKTQALVVWTGGTGRVTEGLHCLEKGLGESLFISGVHEDVTLADITDISALKNRIFLGHHAKSTQENALETKEWLEKNHMHSLRLITAHYHMHRSLLELEAVLPRQKVIPHPITPLSFKEGWWQRKKTLLLALNEYNKFIIAYGRLALSSLL